MIRKLFALIVLTSLLAVSARADEAHNAGVGPARRDLAKSSLTAGRFAVEIAADAHVDLANLFAGIDFSQFKTAQDLADRVNESRKQLYPDAEVILSISPPPAGPKGAVERIALVRAIYWWNNTNCSTCYWYAQYTSTVATMFIDDVQYGAYDVFDKVGSGNWVFRYHTSAGGGSTRYNIGSRTLRGFRGDAARVSSKGDIVMYFFN